MMKSRLVMGLAAALLVSLAVNIYFGGHHLGRFVSSAPCDRQEWRQREEALQAKLSAEDYAIVKKHKQERKKDFRADREQLKAARGKVEAAMQAEPFNPEALEAALAAEQQLKAKTLARMRESRDALSRQLSPEGQKTLRQVMKPPPRSISGERWGND